MDTRTARRGIGYWLGRGAFALLALLVAALVTTALAALAQTQFNLASLQQLGVEVPFGVRLRASGADLLGFSPTFGPIAAIGFLIAFPAAAGLSHWLPGARRWLYALAGGLAILTAMLLMKQIFMLTPVAAARGAAGLAALCVSGALGGLLFARLLDRLAPAQAAS